MAGNRQNMKEIRQRMQELYVYDLYGFRTEIKPLSQLLYPYETINCFATGIHQGKRKMLVVTYYRVLIISTSLGAPADIVEMKRETIEHATYEKRFFLSTLSFEAEGNSYHFSMVSRRVLELFVWAINQPPPIRN
ncbi:PH domain-containing protein [Pleomorphochaeta sp. DL1XJH-081]|uniref:PH domain-containing protein n=1 Tax=Pleomorphochaeta sp. DL1XJH-081 TaxID=3409690 RepID=UPI003BB60579